MSPLLSPSPYPSPPRGEGTASRLTTKVARDMHASAPQLPFPSGESVGVRRSNPMGAQ